MLALPLRPPAFRCGLPRPGRRGAGEPGGVCTLPSPAAPASAHALQPQLRLSAVPGSAEPGIQLLPPLCPPRSFVHPPGPRGRSGGRAAAHFPPPEAEAGPPGRGERGLGGARGAAAGTICPSACGPAGPRREAPGAVAGTSASSRMSGRRLAPGLPRAGAARGSRARAPWGPSPEVAVCPVAFSWGAALWGPRIQLSKVKVKWSKMAKGRVGGLHVLSTTLLFPQDCTGRVQG